MSNAQHTPTRRIRQNVWGNWIGYEGTRRTQEFGTDEVAAGYWYWTGSVDFNAGYADPEKYRAAIAKAKGD